MCRCAAGLSPVHSHRSPLRGRTKILPPLFDAGVTDLVVEPLNPRILANRVRMLVRAGRLTRDLRLSEQRLLGAQRAARFGCWEWNLASNRFWCSEELLTLLGRQGQVEEFSCETFLDCLHPEDREDVDRLLWQSWKRGRAMDLEHRVLRPDGSVRHVRHLAEPVADGHNGGPAMLGAVMDVTAEREGDENLRLYKMALEALPVGVTITDRAGRILFANEAEAGMHGYRVDEMVGMNASDLGPESRRRALHPDNWKQLSCWRRESVNLKRNGEEFPVQLASILVRDDHNRPLGLVTVSEDISERKAFEAQIERLAYFDNLTGLPNRRLFQDHLRQTLALAQREVRQFAVIFVDLDYFKEVNDSFGHAAGDRLLRDVADRLRQLMRESDLLARLGGDEFVVLFTEISQPEGTVAALKRLLHAFEEPFEVEGQAVNVSASLGVAFYPRDGKSIDDLLKAADIAMYQAKAEGRNCYRLFSDRVDEAFLVRMEFVQNFRRALDAGDIQLRFRPQFNLKTSAVDGAEVLLFWESLGDEAVDLRSFPTDMIDAGGQFRLAEWFFTTLMRLRLSGFGNGFKGSLSLRVPRWLVSAPRYANLFVALLRDHDLPADGFEWLVDADWLRSGRAVVDSLNRLAEAGVGLGLEGKPPLDEELGESVRRRCRLVGELHGARVRPTSAKLPRSSGRYSCAATVRAGCC
ncbi:MAG: diguanylate cyclase [Deltaproteobacteria bacterium]|nr:MAG: diguanylate cyclase [Deltaproteobacteria bacterium]